MSPINQQHKRTRTSPACLSLSLPLSYSLFLSQSNHLTHPISLSICMAFYSPIQGAIKPIYNIYANKFLSELNWIRNWFRYFSYTANEWVTPETTARCCLSLSLSCLVGNLQGMKMNTWENIEGILRKRRLRERLEK